MAIIRNSKLRESPDGELEAKLFEYRKELNAERGQLSGGGRTSSPGKIRQLKKTVARVLTILHERKLGISQKQKAAGGKEKSPASPPAAAAKKPADRQGSK